MTLNERKRIFNNICNKYSNEIWIHPGDCGKDNRAYSYISRREIVLPEDSFSTPSEWAILVLLHEIGHIKTNTSQMKECEKEFYATQWSAIEAKKIGLTIQSSWKKAYQSYIWGKRRGNSKNALSKEDLVVKW